MNPTPRILIVDDEPFNVDYLEQELADQGFATVSATNGEEALRQVASDPPDLILLDVIMPGLDGIAVCRILKDDPKTRLIPVVIMTALSATEDRVRGIEAGADDFLSKPVDDRELLARINTALRLKGTVDSRIEELESASEQLERIGKRDEDVSVLVVGGGPGAVDGVLAELEATGADVAATTGGVIAVYRDDDSMRHPGVAADAALALLEQPADPASGSEAGLRLGLESGSALVGPERVESSSGHGWVSTAIGPAVDAATSLVERAPPGQVALGEDAADRLAGSFTIDRSTDILILSPERPEDVALIGTGALEWPRTYAAILPRIMSDWGVLDHIYLTRSLSGKSGARVYAVDITCEDFSGQAILKLDAAGDPAWSEQEEAERHQRAVDSNPGYAASHLPEVVHKTALEGQVATLSTIAGGGLEYIMPWAHSPYDIQLRTAREVSRGIMEGWNESYSLSDGMRSPTQLLDRWLGYRLDPEAGRIHDVLENDLALDPVAPTFIHEGHWFPNPLAFSAGYVDAADAIRLRAAVGNIHGDLHGFNVLIKPSAEDGADYFLIDLAFYEPDSYLFYDNAYFELAYLLHSRETVPLDQWLAVLEAVAGRAPPRADDLGLVTGVNAARDGAQDWIAAHEPNRQSYMEAQLILARVAAGLNFVNKRVPDRIRVLGFLYAASSLKRFIKFQGMDWPRHGPSLLLGGSGA